MGAFISFNIYSIIVIWPCLLLLSYKCFGVLPRLILQSLFLAPITIISSILCFMIGSIIKYFPFNMISNPNQIKIYVLSTLFGSFWQIMFFSFEFWSNLRYVISDENINESDIFNLNAIFIANHSESPFDYISSASILDYMRGTNKSFVFMKKEFLYIPVFGWMSSLCNAIPLKRNWNEDKITIYNVCRQFNDGIDYNLVRPWIFASYPEGTRFSEKKLILSQTFAKERGLNIYKNVLQPRVKGFSYLTNNLYKSLGCIIDATFVYHPKPPQTKTFFIGTRFCKFIHIHLRVYKKNNIPKDIDKLNEWLRNRWTEKDDIINKMKGNKIKYRILKRSPFKPILYYLFFSVIINFIFFNLLIGLKYFSSISILILITSLFPIIIVLIENSSKLKFENN